MRRIKTSELNSEGQVTFAEDATAITLMAVAALTGTTVGTELW